MIYSNSQSGPVFIAADLNIVQVSQQNAIDHLISNKMSICKPHFGRAKETRTESTREIWTTCETRPSVTFGMMASD